MNMPLFQRDTQRMFDEITDDQLLHEAKQRGFILVDPQEIEHEKDNLLNDVRKAFNNRCATQVLEATRDLVYNELGTYYDIPRHD